MLEINSNKFESMILHYLRELQLLILLGWSKWFSGVVLEIKNIIVFLGMFGYCFRLTCCWLKTA